MRFHAFVFAALLAIGLCSASQARAQAPTSDIPIVAAAADRAFALEDAAKDFTGQSGRQVKLSLGSSGNFFRQIQQGAPFQIFLSADEDFVFRLADAGLTKDRGVLYAIGRLALIVPPGSPLQPDGSLADLKAALQAGRVTRFAIANPEHAPYGRRAEETLRHLGLWDAIHDKLVLGENVSQAAQFAVSGGAQGGIVAYSLVLSPQMEQRGRHALIPAEWHQPLRQRMVLLKNADDTAQRFYDYLQSTAGRRILVRYGFVLPGEQS
ncbi:molybdate ABC transporter substrate-binding protein [Ferrovibrio sp.]|uniref:molybdate ABC transporter substrate-binding protein n=1 Tax=Ferrovibrio sp. TaxID=1917215 RepID=UPI0035AF3041